VRLLPQLYDLPDDGWLSRAGGHGGAMGEERVVDVVPLGRLSFISCQTYLAGRGILGLLSWEAPCGGA
jgi:hypothetical protein